MHVDLTIGKNIKVTERVNMLLQMSAFNVLNRAYYATPDPNLEDSSFSSFLQNTYENGNQESPGAGGAYFQGLGNRNIQLTGKITF